MVEPRLVMPVVVGSSPIIHPIFDGMPFTAAHPDAMIPASGPLAQLVEQLTLNQRAVGSSPTRPTIL